MGDVETIDERYYEGEDRRFAGRLDKTANRANWGKSERLQVQGRK